LHYFLYVLSKLLDDSLFLLCLFLLISDFDSNLIDFALYFAQTLSMLLQCAALILKVFLQLQKLILQAVN